MKIPSTHVRATRGVQEPVVRESLLAVSLMRGDRSHRSISSLLRPNAQPMSKQELVAIIDEALMITDFDDPENQALFSALQDP